VRLPPTLLALTPGDVEPGGTDALLRAVAAAISAGLRGVLLREPRLDERAFLDLARGLRAALDDCAPAGWLGVHDRAHAAVLARADGLHVGFRSLRPADARRAAPGLALGLSAHASDDDAAWRDADYLFFGPVNDTPSKRNLLAHVGLDGLAAGVARAAGTPVWALGGLGPDDVAPCRAAGAQGVAALGGILASADPAAAAARYLAACAERVA
jgi:thiamine-phosphate pyrophosphorylase